MVKSTWRGQERFYSLTFRIKSSRMSKRLTDGAGNLGQKKLYPRCEVIKQHVSLGEKLTVPNTYNTGSEAMRRELKL